MSKTPKARKMEWWAKNSKRAQLAIPLHTRGVQIEEWTQHPARNAESSRSPGMKNPATGQRFKLSDLRVGPGLGLCRRVQYRIGRCWSQVPNYRAFHNNKESKSHGFWYNCNLFFGYLDPLRLSIWALFGSSTGLVDQDVNIPGPM